MNRIHIRNFCCALPALVLLVALAGCAPKQRVPLDCVPEQVTIYVDGHALDETPDELELRADEPHKIYFKGEGYEPQLIVLESGTDSDGAAALAPAEVCVELVAVEVERSLTLTPEVEPTPASPAPSP